MHIIDKDLHTEDIHKIVLDVFEPTNKNSICEGTAREFKIKMSFITLGLIGLVMLIRQSVSILGVIASVAAVGIGIELVWKHLQWHNSEANENGLLGILKSISWIFALLIITGVIEWSLAFLVSF